MSLAAPASNTLGTLRTVSFAVQHRTLLIAGGLAVVLLLQFSEVFRRGINWDEFHHYNHLWTFRRGLLDQPLLTLHTRAFGWVIDLPGSGVDHIVVIRMFMFAFECITLAAIAGIVARLSDVRTGLLCALAYVSHPFVFGHGYSFRFDPPATAVMISALWLLITRRLDLATILGAGALIGIGLMVTIKIVLLLPAFIGVLWLRWSEHKFNVSYALRVAATGAVALMTFGAIFLWHSQGIAGDSAQTAAQTVGSSGSVMFALEPKPFWATIVAAGTKAPFTALLIVLFPVMLAAQKRSKAIAIALIGLYLPLTTLFFYHNTAPYFYVFMLPWVLIACSVSMPWLTTRVGALATAALFVLTAVFNYAFQPDSPIEKQRQLITAAQEAFPKGTGYFDFMGMLPHLDKANEFMTFANIASLQTRDVSIYSQAMADQPVPLLFANDPPFQQLFERADGIPMANPSLPAFTAKDAAALRDTYVPFWGPFYLAGEQIAAGDAPHPFTIRVPGPYTLSGASLTIKGRDFADGDVIQLERGDYVVESARSSPATLMWGDNLAVPAGTPPAKPYRPSW